jgi:histone H2A
LDRLNKLLGDVVISQGGVVPFINPEVSHHIECIGRSLTDFLQLLPSKTQKGKKESQEV